jgi:hypothetical protein
MKRLVVEFSANNIGDSRVPSLLELLEKVRSLRILHILKMAPGEFAAVVRVEMKDPSTGLEDLFLAHTEVEIELLQKDKGGTCTYFVSSKFPTPLNVEQLSRIGQMPYFSVPFEFYDGKLTETLVGSSLQIKKYLGALEQQRLRYRIVSLMDAKCPPGSPISRLTEKQRRVLIAAYRLGYYDVPRRITSERLAEKLGLVKSTLSAHIRKAERRLLSGMLSEFWRGE